MTHGGHDLLVRKRELLVRLYGEVQGNTPHVWVATRPPVALVSAPPIR